MASCPFTLPPSSQWLQRQDGRTLIIQAGGDPLEYRIHPDCLPFLMLLDMAQLTYLSMSNSGQTHHQETFYKGVIFLDNLRRNFLATIQNLPAGHETQRAPLPESMHRWLCRFLHAIPHDPKNRRQHAQLLNKVYLEIDLFKYGELSHPLTHAAHSWKCRLLTLVAYSQRGARQLLVRSIRIG